jgi:electron transport complex protein RnfC
VLRDRIEEIKKGIKHLHRIASIGKISFVIHPDLVSCVQGLGYDFYTVRPVYPSAIPKLIVKDILGELIFPGMEIRDIGIEFMSAEAMASLGNISEGRLSFDKLITVITKDYSIVHVKARIGTPISYLLEDLDIEVAYGDRIIMGGPMSGKTIYSLDIPVDYDTDAIFIQDKAEIMPASDTHCINCGECVKICPVNVPVNMLVRVLENGLFEEAAREYDLLSCVECGLCSYVCIARIPVFHYIMLGKYELSKMGEQNA